MGVTKPREMARQLPTHHEASETFMDVFSQWFSEDVRPIGSGCYLFDTDGTIGDMVPKMVKLERDVFCARAKLSFLVSEVNTGSVVLIDDRWRKRSREFH
jgi:hypothetical protein